MSPALLICGPFNLLAAAMGGALVPCGECGAGLAVSPEGQVAAKAQAMVVCCRECVLKLEPGIRVTGIVPGGEETLRREFGNDPKIAQLARDIVGIPLAET